MLVEVLVGAALDPAAGEVAAEELEAEAEVAELPSVRILQPHLPEA